MNALSSRVREWFSVPHRLIGVSIVRVCLGLLTLAFYVFHMSERGFLWGDNGLYPFETFIRTVHVQHTFSFYAFSSSGAFENAVFVFGMLVTVAFTLGYRTRITSVLFFLCTWSLYNRDPILLDGGDNLLILMAFYLMFTDCGARFSIDDALRKAQASGEAPFRALVHNFGVLAMIAQLSLLYFTSAFFKMQGHMWQDGTAIYYVLRAAEFQISPLAHYIYDNAVLCTLLTWSTFAYQIAWPFLIWNRTAKPFIAVGAVALHLSIAYFMGLFWFSMVMITCEFIIFGDRDYVRYEEFGKALWGKFVRAFGATEPVEVFYDAACPACTAIAQRIVRLDVFGSVRLASARDAGNAERLGLSTEQLLARMHVQTESGRIESGAGAFVEILKRIPLAWPVLPVLSAARWAGLAERVYDFVAARRYIATVGNCSDEVCSR